MCWLRPIIHSGLIMFMLVKYLLEANKFDDYNIIDNAMLFGVSVTSDDYYISKHYKTFVRSE